MKTVISLSGGMDSSLALLLTLQQQDPANVHALSFDYGQKQRIELECAKRVTKLLGVEHSVIKLDFLRDFCQGVCANVDENIDVPSAEEVLGDPHPVTEVPNRNMLFASIAIAKVMQLVPEGEEGEVILGVQGNDQYNYWDTTPTFVESLQATCDQIRNKVVLVKAPFREMSKKEALLATKHLGVQMEVLSNTMSCYDPVGDKACGKCNPCKERLAAFKSVGMEDPISYV